VTKKTVLRIVEIVDKNRKNQNNTKPLKTIIKFDGFPGEKTILSFKLSNG
jgi:hypothetical protein